ncbi:MAG: purine-nucleoside phosphorylase [Planctomycetota bacterium]
MNDSIASDAAHHSGLNHPAGTTEQIAIADQAGLADAMFNHDARLAPEGSFRGQPILGVVLGSGLGGLADQIETPHCISFRDMPGLPGTTATGHRGQFIVGTLSGCPIVAMAGRLHFYEGHPLETVTHPIRIMHAAGISSLVVSCAAGGLNPRLQTGDLAVLDETISWIGAAMGQLPNVSSAIELPVPRPRPLRTDQRLVDVAKAVAHRDGFTLHRATYLAVNGPNYETRAECRMMRTIGVDVVGMSTVPECLMAASLGMRLLPIAVVTNMAIPDAPVTAAHDDVLDVSNRAGVKLQQIVIAIADRLRRGGPEAIKQDDKYGRS